MFLVPVEIKESEHHGRGIHTLVDIPAGTAVWKPDKRTHVWSLRRMVKKLPAETLREALTSGNYFHSVRKFQWFEDEIRFLNHGGDASNIGSNDSPIPEQDTLIALRQIQAGEELTEDYNDFNMHQEAYPEELREVYFRYCRDRYDFELLLWSEASATWKKIWKQRGTEQMMTQRVNLDLLCHAQAGTTTPPKLISGLSA